jgi:predicted permease
MIRDLRFAIRALRGSPGFALLAVMTLAVGLASTTIAFCWVEKMVLSPIPGSRDMATLAGIESVMPTGSFQTNSVIEYLGFRDNLKLVSSVAASDTGAFTLGEGGGARRVWGELVTGNLFSTLGVKPYTGRLFRQGEIEDKLGAYPMAVISYRLWKQEFGADPEVLGKPIVVNRHKLTLIGVTEPEFRGTISGAAFDIWIPWTMTVELGVENKAAFEWKGSRGWNVLARLKPGVSFEQADAEVKAVAARMDAVAPKAVKGVSATLSPVAGLHFGLGYLLKEPLLLLLAFSFLVLLIVCSNIANLLLARSVARRKEYTIRLAMGAGSWGLVRLLTVETLLLSLAAGVAGIPMALWAGDAVAWLLPPTGLPISVELDINLRILGFVFAACVAAALISSLLPAILAFRMNLNEALKDDGRGQSASRQTHRMRSLLVVGEVALASFALVAAGFIYQTFRNVRQMRLGFEPKGVLVASLYLSDASYNLEQVEQFFASLQRRLSEAPGVKTAAYADQIPLDLGSHPWHDIVVEGYVPVKAAEMQVERSLVSPGYFDLMRIRLTEGRDFTERDVRKQPDVMIVNQSFAKRFFQGGAALGRKVRINNRTFTVVGLVADSRYHHPLERPRPYFYVPFQQYFNVGLPTTLYVRTEGDPSRAAQIMRREIAALDAGLGGFHAAPLAEYIVLGLMAEKIAAGFMGAIACVALLLSAVGLYSVMSYSVVERGRELGIRVALGASPMGVTRLVLGGGLALCAVGLAAGIGAGLWAARMVEHRLVGVSAKDPATVMAVAAFVLGIGALATLAPAWRATRIDPIAAMRGE